MADLIKVLLIDDSKEYCHLFRYYFKKIKYHSYEIDWVDSSKEGLAALAANKHDIYFLDYRIDELNGIDILKIARKNGCDKPIIMLTAEDDIAIDMAAMKAGASDYLCKVNVDPGLLGRAIRYALERYNVEQQLRRSEAKYRSLFEQIADPIFIYDKETLHFLDCNQSALDNYLYSLEELRKMTPLDLSPPGEIPAIKSHIRQLAANSLDADKPNIFTGITKTGKRVRIEMATGEIEYQNRAAILSIVRDVTKREQVYRETELLISSISAILISARADDKITHWNTAAQNVFGIPQDDVLGQSFVNCGINWNWIQLLEAISNLWASNEPVRLLGIKYIRPDGKEGFLNVNIFPIFRDDKIYSGYLLLADEITERKALETKLLHAQKLESIGQLAAGIAHEINTPIQYVGDNTRFLDDAFNGLKTILDRNNLLLETAKAHKFSEQLLSEIESAAKEADLDYLLEEIPLAIKQSLDGVDRVAKIVRAMKEFSHPGQAEKKESCINEAITNTVTVAKNEWKYNSELELDLDASLPPIPCFVGELNQVFLNMIVNATHAIEDAIKSNLIEKGKIIIKTRRLQNQVEISFQDNGCGIPDAIVDKVFDPFFTTKEVGKGTGQGLAISYSVIVEKHQGRISLKSEVGKGTTFFVYLPIK